MKLKDLFKKKIKYCECGHKKDEHETVKVNSVLFLKCRICDCKNFIEYKSDKDNPKNWDIVP